jgi:ABC-type Na+ efflux pump permease subunit
MRTLHAIATLCLKELTILVRDRQAAALLFGMPAIFVLLLSLALEDIHANMVGKQLKAVLEVEDDGDFGRRIEQALRDRGNFDFIQRPEGLTDRELFRDAGVRALIRIPDKFTERAQAFLATGANASEEGLGAARIEWQASPTLDASYRWFLEAQLGIVCMGLVQEELVTAQENAGQDLERLGEEYRSTAEQLEQVAAQLQGAVGQLEDMQNLLQSSPDEFEALGLAAVAEDAAREEARAALEALGDIPQDGLMVAKIDPPLQPQPKNQVVFTPLIARGQPSAELAELDRLMEEKQAVPLWLQDLQKRQGTGSPTAGIKVEETAGAKLFLRHAGGERNDLPTPLQQTVPGWSLFAMFFIVVPLSQGVHRERSEGTLKRMLTLGVPRIAIVLGKFLPYVFVGVIQFTGMMAVGLYLVPLIGDQTLEFGDKPAVLIPITLVCSFAATSYALMVASLTRTPEQAAAFGATSVVILSALGGVMVPHFVMPAILQKAALASPMYWGHQAYLDAFLHGAGVAEVSLALQVLTVFAVVCLAIASRRIAK